MILPILQTHFPQTMRKPLLCYLGVHRPYGCEWRGAAKLALHHCANCSVIWPDTRSEPRHGGHVRYRPYTPTRQARRAATRRLARLTARMGRFLRE